jgi:hypothetical protein
LRKQISPALQVEQFGNVATCNGSDTTFTRQLRCETPASACKVVVSKLEALTMMISGEGFDAFDGLNDQSKANVLWLISDLAEEASVLAELAVRHEQSAAVTS